MNGIDQLQQGGFTENKKNTIIIFNLSSYESIIFFGKVLIFITFKTHNWKQF